MDIAGVVGLDSISSLDQENNPLSSRSTSSFSSMEDGLAGHQLRKKKSNTLSRLRKLKKHGSAELQRKVDELTPSSPIADITKDVTDLKLENHVNGNIAEARERAEETKDTVVSKVQDGPEEISSLLSREKEALRQRPSPSPRTKPRRIRPLDGAPDGLEDRGEDDGPKRSHGQLESLIHPPPLARPRLTPLDGGSDLVDSLVKTGEDTGSAFRSLKDRDLSSSSGLKTEPRPSPRVKPRRFGNLEEVTMRSDETDISKERTDKRSALSEEWSIVHSGQKTKLSRFADSISKPMSSTLDRVSLSPPPDPSTNVLSSEKEHLSEQRTFAGKKLENDVTPIVQSMEEAIVPQSSEIVHSEPTHLTQISNSNESSGKLFKNMQESDADVDLSEDSDSEDIVVIPDNSPKKSSNKTEISTTAILNGPLRSIAVDGQSNPVEVTSSMSSLTDVSKSLSPQDTSTPTKPSSEINGTLYGEPNRKGSLQSTDDEEVLIVSTFADKENKTAVEETIVPSIKQREESAPKRLTYAEIGAELNNLSNDETFHTYLQSVGPRPSGTTFQEGGELGDQTKQDSESRDACPSPLIHEHPPPPLSSDFPSYERDGVDNSVALSEPNLGTTSTSQLLDTNRSFMSTGALSTITTRTARSRTYLSGGASTSGSLLSKDELNRFFPDHKVKIFVATWNMCEGKVFPDNLEELLLPEDCVLVQDMYVIGTQESSSDGQEWEIRLQETLGPSHVLLHSATHGVLRLLIFIRRDLIWFCSVVEDDTVSTRAFSMIKTKGAVAVGFTFFGTSFLFINSHFTAGDEQIKERIADYEKIIKDLQLPIKVPPTRKYNNLDTDVTSRFDCIFWCGDFNFRLVENRTKVENWAGKLRDGKEKNYDILLQHDQLKKNMSKKSIFRGFHEGKIEFLPTYKYDIGGDVYDSSAKARVPSYTDRVLFKSRRSAQIHNVLYNACNSIKVSDHRPVYAMFEVKIRPGKDDSLTSGGVFSREVFNEANRRRAAKAAMSGMLMSQKSSTVCSVM